nr:PREDICTED: protein bric-a-brac 2-like [Bemisia tabaci]
MGTQQFSLRWNNYLRHITGAFDSLRTDSDLVDVTLSCEGKKIKAHKMLLSACSSYFKDLFKDNPCQHPVIIFRNVKFDDLDALVNFMYQGEVNVLQDQLASFLTTAELLEVQGLTDGGNNPEEEEEPETEQPPPPPVQHREFRPEKRRSVPQSNNQTMSPVSFIPINKRPESPPQKRRKFVSSTSSVQSGDKDLESRRPMQQQQHPSPDPVEVIPVVPNVKVEKPDYYDGDQGGGDYSDNLHTSNSNQELPEMLEHGQIESKQEAVDIYEDSDSSHVEGLSDLNQILNKPGTSVESVSQESLHGKNNVSIAFPLPVN